MSRNHDLGKTKYQEEAFEQMNFSRNGVNFDTAELYPVPATPDKYADTEKIIGNWFSKPEIEIKLF